MEHAGDVKGQDAAGTRPGAPGRPSARAGSGVQPRAIVDPNLLKELAQRIITVEQKLPGVISQALAGAERKLQPLEERVTALEEQAASIAQHDLADESYGADRPLDERSPSGEGSIPAPAAVEERLLALEDRAADVQKALEEWTVWINDKLAQAGSRPEGAEAPAGAAGAATSGDGAAADALRALEQRLAAQEEALEVRLAELDVQRLRDRIADDVRSTLERPVDSTQRGPLPADSTQRGPLPAVDAPAAAEAPAVDAEALANQVTGLALAKAMEVLDARLAAVERPAEQPAASTSALDAEALAEQVGARALARALEAVEARLAGAERPADGGATAPAAPPDAEALRAVEARLAALEEERRPAAAPAEGAAAPAPGADAAALTEQVTGSAMQALEARLADLDLPGLGARLADEVRATLQAEPAPGLGALEERLAALEARPAPGDAPRADGDDGAALGALEERLAALEARPAPGDAPRADGDEGGAVRALEERLTALEARVATSSTGAAAAADVDAVTERVMTAVLGRVMDALDARLAKLDRPLERPHKGGYVQDDFEKFRQERQRGGTRRHDAEGGR